LTGKGRARVGEVVLDPARVIEDVPGAAAATPAGNAVKASIAVKAGSTAKPSIAGARFRSDAIPC